METKSPARNGRAGPSTIYVCAIFSTIVCDMRTPSTSVANTRLLSQYRFAALVVLTAQAPLSVSPCGLHLPHIRLHQRHQFADRPDAFQVPDRLFHPLLSDVCKHALGECRELFFNFPIG